MSEPEALDTRARPEPQPVGSTPGRSVFQAAETAWYAGFMERDRHAEKWDEMYDFAAVSASEYARGYALADQIMALPSEGEELIREMREALQRIADAPAWGAPERWETTPAEVRQLAREALARADQHIGREVG